MAAVKGGGHGSCVRCVCPCAQLLVLRAAARARPVQPSAAPLSQHCLPCLPCGSVDMQLQVPDCGCNLNSAALGAQAGLGSEVLAGPGGRRKHAPPAPADEC